jgi:hypothetical protein
MKKVCFLFLFFLAPLLFVQASEITILDKPVFVSVMPKEKDADYCSFLVKIKFGTQSFILDAGWEGSRLNLLLDEFKRRARWKGQYLFIAES